MARAGTRAIAALILGVALMGGFVAVLFQARAREARIEAAAIQQMAQARQTRLMREAREHDMVRAPLETVGEAAALDEPVEGLSGLRERPVLRQSPAGGFDAAAHIDEAFAQLARRIERDLRLRALEGHDVRGVQIEPAASFRADRNADNYVARMVAALKRRKVRADDARVWGGVVVEVAAYDESDTVYGQAVEARTRDGSGSWTVLVDPSLEDVRAAPAAPTSPYGSHYGRRTAPARCELRFKTGVQTTPDASYSDAIDFLAARIRDEVRYIARTNDWVDVDDERRFDRKLEQRFSRDILIGIGERRMLRKTLQLGDDEGPILHQTAVAWSADRRALTDIARDVSNVLVAERREPWVKFGLCVGVAILGILGWLKIDWWLKGRYSFLTKLAFVMLVVVSVGIIRTIQIHV